MRILLALLAMGSLAASGQQPKVTLTTSPMTAVLGQPVNLTASVTPSPSAGTVTFFDGVSILGVRGIAGGQAVFTTRMLGTGPHVLRAFYSGSWSGTVGLTVTSAFANTLTAGGQFRLSPGVPFLAAGDFNGDGRTDFAALSGISLVILLGNADGSFSTAANYPVTPASAGIAVGDFNGDGKMDLAVNSIGSAHSISIYLGNGDGTFQTPTSFAAGAFRLATGDFNDDGKADLLALDGTLEVWLGNGDGTFQNAISSGSVPTGTWATIGDFNGDRKADVAVVSIGLNEGPGAISLFPGNGDGTFGTPSVYVTGDQPLNAVSGDFNSDGKLDLAYGNSLDNTVGVLLGNGDGTFQGPVNYPAGYGLTVGGVAAGDFNGDGETDLLTTNGNVTSSAISVLLGNGDGTFQQPVSYAASSVNQYAGLAIGDFNGDGKTDVAAPTGRGDLMVLLGAATAATTTSVLVSPNSPVYGDSVTLTAWVSNSSATGSIIFYDGWSAIGTVPLAGPQASMTTTVLQPGTHTLTAVYSGDANNAPSLSPAATETVASPAGTSTTSLATSANPSRFGSLVTLTATVAPAGSTGSVTFYDGASVLGSATLAGGQATLATGIVAVGQRSLTAIYGGDPNTGGSASSPLMETIWSTPVTGFQAAASFGSGPLNSSLPVAIAVGDFNGDGIPDLAAANSEGNPGNVSIYLGKGDGTFGTASNLADGSGPVFIAVGDFNRDGNADLAVSDRDGGTVSVLLGKGDGTFQPAIAYPTGPASGWVVVSDFNGDGKPDLLVVSDLRLNVLLGNGDGTFQTTPGFGGGTNPSCVAVGDLNGDGRVDLLVAQASIGRMSVFLGNGDGTFQFAGGYSAGLGSQGIAVGDFDGDGKLDVAVANEAANSVSVFIGNGDGTFQTAVNYAGAPGALPDAVAAGDFNGDGKIDLAVGFTGGVQLLYGNGDGTFSVAPEGIRTGFWPPSLAIADFNGDGAVDLAAGARAPNSIYISLGKPATVAANHGN